MLDAPLLQQTTGIAGLVCTMSFQGRSYTVAMGKTQKDVWHIGLQDHQTGDWAQFALEDVKPEPVLTLDNDVAQAKITEENGQVAVNGVPLFQSLSQSVAIGRDGSALTVENVTYVGDKAGGKGGRDLTMDVIEGIATMLIGGGKIVLGVLQIITGIKTLDPKAVIKGVMDVADGVVKVVKGLGKLLKAIFGKKKDGVMIPSECFGPNPPEDCGLWGVMGDQRFATTAPEIIR
ncbi:hypothetical protein [Tropicibacter naphthalenivorans]|uniref:Uncharacterized protein n=1 Tax=Tropicibacter naphthalenivorans TaxID=441103 RepID=A0A0P1GKA0_9RHOB|nr:hypothetical protein [Tropicibacter naphthalenivorans]CUH82336.1 hypothetical protein TRN7648_03918 [Tropicibacter naphthalenivorans]SMD05655.1 hypothetical protein SAMN04488093_11332 [Tropicibacter naphthalenivorans]